MGKLTNVALVSCLLSGYSQAGETDSVQDMSDPLAVYTQVGAGYTNTGLNLKLGQTFDTGEDTTMGMHVFEVKGILGDTLSSDENARDSVQSLRYRKFEADLTNGRGSQIDSNYDFENESGSISYSIIQSLPALGPLQLFPLAGAGFAFGNNVMGDNGEVISGYSVPGTFGVVGTYSKLTLTENIWLNYNPMWMTTLSGSNHYKSGAFGGESQVFAHEFAASYQINPRFNLRYFANWTQHQRFNESAHRLEFNYQL